MDLDEFYENFSLLTIVKYFTRLPVLIVFLIFTFLAFNGLLVADCDLHQ